LNYAGKFDGAISSDGPGNHSHFVHLNPGHTHAPADAIVVPDAHFLFNADFKRSGVDLVLSGDDRELVLHDYFKGEKHKALASPDGAHLTGDMVNALTGHVEIAQAGGAASASAVIGHVTKLGGSATVIRNGVSIILNMGDNVEKGDVVQSGSNSTVGITFIDGTVFGLSSNARMVLNDMVYDPNGSNNSSLLSLVAGTMTFVAGETAKHGDMKIDTPVATMGIRGTAVLVEIDFSIPGANGAPNASFQVLVEPDGTTGSYILFDKTTLQPLAIVNQAGQQININNGVISQTQNPLSPDMQKLITDVFQQKFTDNTNNNTKTASTIGSSTADNTQTLTFEKNGTTATATFQTAQDTGPKDKAAPNGPTGPGVVHVSGAPIVSIGNGIPTTSYFFAEIPGTTNDAVDLDQVKFTVVFSDINVGDAPTVKAEYANLFTYKDAQGHDVTGSLSNLQKADIDAVAIKLALTPNPGNTNTGQVDVLYSLADKNFDFLAAGETLTLTYYITVNNNYGPNPESIQVPITIEIVGTNDQPIITTGNQAIHFAAGTGTSGGSLVSADATSGTFDFTDVDLTDTHWIIDANKDPAINPNADPKDATRFSSVSIATLTSASLAGPNGTLDKAALEALAPGPMSIFEKALDVSVTTDATGTGHGVITWQLENLPVFLADFIPAGETLKLFYTIEVTDEQGSTDTKIVEVDITGKNAAATVWIHTTDDGHDGNWTTGSNWGTGKTPTSVDDVIIVTDQLHPHTPAYPATITSGTQAAAHSVVMNDFVATNQTIPPELKLENGSSLTIGVDFDLSADSILTNAGTVNVGNKLELLDDATNPVTPVNKSVITNSGTINIGQGGDIQGLAIVTNSGTIELQGGTLNVDVNIANSAGGQGGNINVDSGAKIVLGTDVNAGGITGGTVTVKSGGELDLTGSNTLSSGVLVNNGQVNVTGTGNVLDAETVNNTGNSNAIDITGALVAKNGTVITNALPNVSEASGETIESGGTLTLQDTSSIANGHVVNKGTLNLQGTSTLKSGFLDNTGTVNVSGSGNTFDAEVVTNTGASNAIDITGSLTLKHGTTVDNTNAASGETVESGATLTLQDTSSIWRGKVTNIGTLNLQTTGATFVLSDGALSNTGQVNVTGNNVLSNEIVSNTGNGSAIDIVGVLAVVNSTAITNTDGNSGETIEGAGKLTLQDTSSISGGVVTNKGTLILEGTSSLNNGVLANTGQIDVFGTASLNGETVTANNMLEVLSSASLTIDQGSTVTNTGTIQIDSGVLVGTLTLQDTSSITGGQVTNNGVLNLQGTSFLKNGTLTNSNQVNVTGTGNTFDHETVNNNATIDVAAAALLTLDNGTAITNGAAANSETVEGTLTLQDTSSITAGTVTVANTGTLNLQGTATLKNGTLTNGNQVNVTGSGNTLDHETVNNNATIDVAAAALLTLDNGTAITNGAAANSETVEGTLTLQDTSSITAGTVTVSSTGKLNLQGTSSLSNGTLANSGTLNASGSGNALHNIIVSTNNMLEVLVGAALTLDQNTSVANASGTVKVDSTATLTLNNASITNGTVTNAGTINSTTGGGSINQANITNTGTIESTSGTLTIDPAATYTLTNSGIVKADGGEIDFFHEQISNSNILEAIDGGTLKLNSLTVSNTGTGTVTVGTGSKLYLTGAGITGGQLGNSGTLYNVSGVNTVSAAVTSTGTIDVQGGTLNLSGGLTGAGTLDIDDTATLEIAGADAQTVTFTGGTGKLQLDNTSIPFTGTITGQSSVSGNFTVTGAANITTTSGDALDFNASGGTSLAQAKVTISTSGTLTGKAGGIAVIQNGAGDITVSPTGDVTGLAGHGILAEDSATGSGNITITTTGKATGTGANTDGILATNLNAANNGNISVTASGGAVGGTYGIEAVTQGSGTITLEADKTITGTAQYGIRAVTYGSGNITVTTDANAVITSGSSGINVANLASAVDANAHSAISVTARGTINSGTTNNLSGSVAGGIYAGFKGNDASLQAVPDLNVNGRVTVTSYANITAAAGYGINAYNWGNGDVTVNDDAGTIIAAQSGISATQNSGGTGDVAVTIAQGLSITGTSAVGINAVNMGSGDTTVTTAASDSITAGTFGINALNEGTTATHNSVSVTANGTINGATGIHAGYQPGNNSVVNATVTGDVTVTSNAVIHATNGDGIDAFNYGSGDVTISTGTTSAITASADGLFADAFGGGDVNVTNKGSISAGLYGIFAATVGAGNIVVGSTGGVTATGTGTIGILAENLDTAGTGDVSVTESGGVSGGLHGIQAINKGSGDVTVEAGGAIVGTTQYGVRSENYGAGNNTVTTDAGSTINSGGAGINVVNFASAIDASAGSTITVNNKATITSGSQNNGNGTAPQGIVAGYYGGPGAGTTGGIVNPLVHGTVTVNNDGNITAAVAYGIQAYNEGIGDVTINESANTSITAQQVGVGAFILGGGAGNAAVNLGDHVQITTTTGFGIQTSTAGSGTVAVNMTDDGNTDSINSGGSGIVAVNTASTLASTAHSTVTVNAHGTINSGANGTGTIAGILAGYNGSSSTPKGSAVNGTVTVNNYANVTAAAGFGIDAFNWGSGDVTVNDQDGTTVSGAAGANAAGIGAFSLGGSGGTGNVAVNLFGTAKVTDSVGFGISASNTGSGTLTITTSQASQVTGGTTGINANASGGKLTLTNDGTVSGATGVFAGATGSNDIAITNAGSITGTGTAAGNAGINVAQAGAATGSTTITNSGTIAGTGSHAAISVAENTHGTAVITNTGTIGSATNTNAIFESGGNLAINNNTLSVDDGHGGQTVTHGVIDGVINAATTTFINEAGASWNAVGSSTFGASSTIDNAGTITLNSASISDANGLTITNDAGGVINGASGINLIDGATINNFGIIEATGGTLTIDPPTPLTLTNTGTLEAITGGTLKLSNIAVVNTVTDGQGGHHDGTVSTDSHSFFDLDSSSITGGNVSNLGTLMSTGTSAISAVIANGGTIEVSTGVLTLFGTISGSGHATIDGGATLELGSNFADGQDVTFNGNGAELIIDSAASLTGNIHGLVATDKIDLQGIDYATATATYDAANGVLTVTDGDNDSIALNIGTGFAGAHFAAVADGPGAHAGTLITLSATDDAPVVAAADKTETASVSERANTTNADSSVTDPAPAASGTIHFTDADLTDRSTVHSVLSVVDAHGTDLAGTLTSGELSALTNALVITPNAANATHNDGSLSWSYSIADNALDFLREGQVVVVKAAVTVTDNFGKSDTAEIDVTITGANDNPTVTAGAQSVQLVEAGVGTAGTASATIALTTADPDTGDAAVYDGAALTTHGWATSDGGATYTETGAYGKATLNTTTGVVSYALDNADPDTNALAAGAHASDNFTVYVKDGTTGTANTAVNFAITGTDDAPTITGESNPATQTVILDKLPIVLTAGASDNVLGLQTETFQSDPVGLNSNNGTGFGNFTSSALHADFTASGHAGVVVGSFPGVTAAPFIGPLPGNADTGHYLSIGANGSETIAFVHDQNTFGLYWGSVDSSNTISFYEGTKLVATYGGDDIAPLLSNGGQSSFSANGYVEFTDLAPFNKVVLASSTNAFELDNISAGSIQDSHNHLSATMSGTLVVKDSDVGDTITANVTDDAVATYNGSTTLPAGLDLSSLVDHDAITFDSVTSNGGSETLHWTYNPADPHLDFLEPSDTLTLAFKAEVTDGHVTTADQALTVTIVGTGAATVHGTNGNDAFVNVGGGVTIFGQGGNDTFQFSPGFASATIADFDVNHDTINIDHTLFSSVQAILAGAQSANSGHDTVITDTAHDQITLKGVTLAQLQAHSGDLHLV
jgi:VCBS repeat-containing protein